MARPPTNRCEVPPLSRSVPVLIPTLLPSLAEALSGHSELERKCRALNEELRTVKGQVSPAFRGLLLSVPCHSFSRASSWKPQVQNSGLLKEQIAGLEAKLVSRAALPAGWSWALPSLIVVARAWPMTGAGAAGAGGQCARRDRLPAAHREARGLVRHLALTAHSCWSQMPRSSAWH